MAVSFTYSAPLLERFPNTVGGLIYATGLHNGPSPELLQAAYTAEQAATLERIGETPLSELPSLAAWRSIFSAFGVTPTKYRSAPEALLRRLTKKGDIPSINTLVDIGNLVSIRYAVPVAVFDARDLGALTVGFADGSETFTALGTGEAENPPVGEVVFADAAKDVYARRWCWRQSARSSAREDTTTVLIAIEAQHENGPADVQKAVDDMLPLLREFTEGEVRQSGVANAQAPIFSVDS